MKKLILALAVMALPFAAVAGEHPGQSVKGKAAEHAGTAAKSKAAEHAGTAAKSKAADQGKAMKANAPGQAKKQMK